MLRKLRWTFIGIMMALLAVVMVAVIVIFDINACNSEKSEIDEALASALETGPESMGLPSIGYFDLDDLDDLDDFDDLDDDARTPPEPRDGRGNNGDRGEGNRGFSGSLPVYCVSVDRLGNVLFTSSTARMDSTTLSEGIAQVIAGASTNGELTELELFYACEEMPNGYRIAFADASKYHENVRHTVLVSVGIGVGALALLFIISLILARIAMRPVEDAWSKQQRFIADASHELKTPLTVILADNGIVASHPESTVAEQMQWVEGINEEATKMKGLVSDLLLLAQTEPGAIAEAEQASRVERIDLSSRVEESILEFEAVAFEGGVNIEGSIAEGIAIDGKPDDIARLIAILIDNACKYARSTISVGLRKEGSQAVLAVNNDGDPIAEEDLPHIFDRFYRADKARSDEKPGFGLGLSIAKNIAEGHGGDISVASSAAAGTTFTVKLPVK